MVSTRLLGIALLALSLSQSVSGLTLNTSDPTSIKNAASIIAHGLMKYYTGNVTNTPETIAVLPAPYYWWEAGAMWGTMLDYYHYTGDSSYNDVTIQALESQVGPLFDYMMPNHQKDEGNDDQAFWGFATMSAAEKNFPQPSNTGGFTWVELTENLWNTQAARWDASSCGGGLKWQIFSFNNGYTYKNSVSNGAFFQLSARLARYTGNQTYVDWAEKVYDWTTEIRLIDSDFNTFDGADDTKGCSDPNEITWSYNNAIFLYGAAVMYNYTTDSTWQSRTQGLLKASANFFTPENIMYEQACETISTCNNDQYSFKAYLSRFMWATTQMAPFTKNTISTYLTKSASAAANICTGDANACGTKWYVGFDGTFGIGQQMSALEVIQGLLVSSAAPPIVKGEALVQSASSSIPSSITSTRSTPTISSFSSDGPNITSASSPDATESSTDIIAMDTIRESTTVPCTTNSIISPPTVHSSLEIPPFTTHPSADSSSTLSTAIISSTVPPSFEVHAPTAIHSSTVESFSTISSSETSSTTSSLTTSAPAFDTTTTVSILRSTTVYTNSTAWFAPSSFLSSHLTTALSTLAIFTTSTSSASSKSSTALLIDTSTQPTSTASGPGSERTTATSTLVSASVNKATVTAAAARNKKISGAGLVAGVVAASLLFGL
ncbi:glycoside hydrolase family 76 protein [Sclerotinia borealis F-4128]|uniref:mannan endo-1,6-alpha-mannosidase n=1 Tax=Sclerotinia borealis (strain F-4128) TaxID=1432307 RepID=W9CF08_SCLBF|nr:glycoside hydrolase family 76 protein [Sclerotinia borealis F-4128]